MPSAGDDFREVDDEREARHIASEREAKMRAAELVDLASADAVGPDASGASAPRSPS